MKIQRLLGYVSGVWLVALAGCGSGDPVVPEGTQSASTATSDSSSSTTSNIMTLNFSGEQRYLYYIQGYTVYVNGNFNELWFFHTPDKVIINGNNNFLYIDKDVDIDDEGTGNSWVDY